MKDKKIVVIGGGTGTYSVLSGLKHYTDQLTAIVTMADSGGSAKKERDDWGLLPSSDIRKSLIALADISTEDNLILRELFQYRYSEGKGISGITFGNLFLIALTKLLKSQDKAIEKAGEILKIKGRVLPVTLSQIDLVAKYADGTEVVGEHFIDEPHHNGTIAISQLYTRPKAEITEKAKEAIMDADIIIIGPGGFYTTILANFVIQGVAEAVKKSKAKKIFILNLMTEYGQTYGFTAYRFLSELDRYFPVDNLDYVVINKTALPESVLKRYHKYRAEPVLNDIPKNQPYKIIEADLLSPDIIKHQKGDTLRRSLIRHNPEKVALTCMRLVGLV